MPKTRQRVVAAVATVEFRAVPTPAVRTLTNLDSGPGEVAGAFVKVAPRLPTSARATFDGPGLAASLRDAGALAVLLAPEWIPDEVREVARVVPAEITDPRAIVAAWFEAHKTGAAEVRDRARELVLSFMDAEGM